MSKKFTVITKDGSKWLRPVRDCIEVQDYIDEIIDNAFGVSDVPYIGNRPDGTTVDESEVEMVSQGRDEGMEKWITEDEGEYPKWAEYRTAYADAEPPDIDYEKEMPHKEWPSTKYVARKVDAEPHGRHITDNSRYPLFQHLSEEHGLTLLDSELDEIARHAAPMTGVDYWKRRCKAAEIYINESPCDPDITPAQEAAYNAWQKIVKQQPK